MLLHRMPEQFNRIEIWWSINSNNIHHFRLYIIQLFFVCHFPKLPLFYLRGRIFSYFSANLSTKKNFRYISSLKETQKASKNFYDALRETYESNWPEHQDFVGQVDIIEHKWTDYIQTLVNDVHMPLISYLNEFPELKKKIEKRDNRLLDYDNARHNLESIFFSFYLFK